MEEAKDFTEVGWMETKKKPRCKVCGAEMEAEIRRGISGLWYGHYACTRCLYATEFAGACADPEEAWQAAWEKAGQSDGGAV